MAESAFVEQFRQETIAAFEVNESLVRKSTTTEAVMNGNEATFLVAGSGGAEAVTRGVNGLIQGRADDLNQTTVQLVEWHDLPLKTRYNIFASQGDQRAIMQRTSVGVMNRKIDSDIIGQLNTATVNTGAAIEGSVALALRAKTILGNNDVPWDGRVTCLITTGFESYLLQEEGFSSADYVSNKPLENASMAWNDQPGYYMWAGIKWIVHPGLPGTGTGAEKCFMYHESAIGHAMDSGNMNTAAGYNEEQDYSFCRTSCFMGTKILQNSGIVVINHDSSALAAA